MRVHYSYSDVVRYDSLLMEWQDCIAEDLEELQWIDRYLDQLTDPFTFFMNVSDKAGDLLDKEEREDAEEQRQGDNKYI